MGNLCSWCFKSQDQLQTNGTYSGLNNIEPSVSSSVDDERTPLIGKSDNHHTSTIIHHQSTLNGDSSIIAPLLPPPHIINEPTTVSTNETAETKMAFIVEGMLSKLIDVGGSNNNNNNTNISQTNSNINIQNEHLKHLLNKSLSSTKLISLPDAGLNNLPSLLSGRPISSNICHFVAHTAGELSRLLIDEIKIIHKEDLVVVFE